MKEKLLIEKLFYDQYNDIFNKFGLLSKVHFRYLNTVYTFLNLNLDIELTLETTTAFHEIFPRWS